MQAGPLSGRNADQPSRQLRLRAEQPRNTERSEEREGETSGENYFLFMRTGYTNMTPTFDPDALIKVIERT